MVPRRADHGGIDISPICLLAHGHTQLANIPHNTRQIETIRYLLPATFSRRFTGIPSCRINYCWCVIPHTTFIPILSCDRPQLANMSHNTLHTKTINFLVSDTFAKTSHLANVPHNTLQIGAVNSLMSDAFSRFSLGFFHVICTGVLYILLVN